ncbi:ABC transporter permease [Gloeocapsa sp. PCC 73106]|uniref:ABC transporter permease n=1 Tax=Gloeocapsa sp. PCC 73106 TaxID=102232 RepID=UPI0002ABA1CA|nr:ABC transporter permease [Gloeocapsa sp. PCC 73106]ELR99116.1 ABC-type dipeptide/oligopeptide/nickel transport system, permease component [Gloeocapsa sp. PCC 73106]
MKWWSRLKQNPLAQLGGTILLTFYLIVTLAGFFAPYDPYSSQIDGSLLSPTRIYWRNTQQEWIGPHVYPTTLGPTDLETGERKLSRDYQKPSPIRLFVKGRTFNFLGLKLNRQLFGTVGEGYLNILGTDEQGRDQLSRLIYGGRISLFIGIVGIAISFPLGMLIGGISGYFGGVVDAVLMRLAEVLMTIPGIYLLVALAAVLPLDLTSAQRFLLIVAITSLISWAGLARVTRGQVLAIKEQEFVQAAKAMGARPLYLILRHILPQTASYMIISATLAIPGFIIAESVLSLIGLGIQQPYPSWGNLLSLATNASILVLNPWLIWPPAAVIILTVLAFNLLGDGLRDALDPRSNP